MNPLIFETPLKELYSLRSRSEPLSLFHLYCEVLIAYLSGDSSGLESLIMTIQELKSKPTEAAQDPCLSELNLIYDVSMLRLKIRTHAITEQSLEAVLQWIERAEKAPSSQPTFPATWLGELHFIAARALEIQKQDQSAARHYYRSHEIFMAQGCAKKSVKALQNSIACESRVQPELNYIYEFQKITKLARSVKEFGIAGVALMNISRELEAMGALNSALRLINRAIMLMSRDAGTVHYFLAIIHRCHLHQSLKNLEAAMMDLETAKLSNHAEIQAAVVYLEQRQRTYQAKAFESEEHKSPRLKPTKVPLTFGWQARLLDVHQTALSPQEDRMIGLLCSQPRDKGWLMNALWGQREDQESLSLRFKDLVNRVRIKREGLVLFCNNRYQLASNSYCRFLDQTSAEGINGAN